FRTGSGNGNWSEARSTALAGICLNFRESGDSVWLRSITQWIEKNQINEGEAAGSWGEEVWDTAMCLLALKSFGISSKDSVIQNGIRWILSLYSLNGRKNWHDEPWETSWALLAILTSGIKTE